MTINGGTQRLIWSRRWFSDQVLLQRKPGKKVLVVELDASFFSSNMTDLTDQTADAVAVTGDFATGVKSASVTECSYCTTR